MINKIIILTFLSQYINTLDHESLHINTFLHFLSMCFLILWLNKESLPPII
jgi:hypothetical protein